jgi:hypothetical protein
MSNNATWAVRVVLAGAAACAAVTFAPTLLHRAEAAVKPPLDASVDSPISLPPLPDARLPLSDAADTPL